MLAFWPGIFTDDVTSTIKDVIFNPRTYKGGGVVDAIPLRFFYDFVVGIFPAHLSMSLLVRPSVNSKKFHYFGLAM